MRARQIRERRAMMDFILKLNKLWRMMYMNVYVLLVVDERWVGSMIQRGNLRRNKYMNGESKILK
jgi:hypothetical protein